MFKKPFKPSATNLLKSSEKRKLRSTLITEFPNLGAPIQQDSTAPAAITTITQQPIEQKRPATNNENQDEQLTAIDLLIPAKEDVTVLRLPGHILVYCVGNNPQIPVFFDLNGKGDLFPTLYSMWKVPHILIPFVTHSPVSEYILGGADMMLPGVIVPPGGFGNIKKGDKAAIMVNGNPFALAVGRVLQSSEEMAKNKMRGKGVEVVHLFGDYLWQLGPKEVPIGFTEKRVYGLKRVEESDEEEEEQQAEAAATGAEDQKATAEEEGKSEAPASAEGDEATEQEAEGPKEESHEEQQQQQQQQQREAAEEEPKAEETDTEEKAEAEMTEADMDKALEYAFMEAIKTLVQDKDLPISVSTLYSNHLLLCKPEDTHLDVKKSSYKKINKFIQEMNKKKLIKTKEVKGVLQVLSINREHPEYKAFTPIPRKKKAAVENASTASKSSAGKSEEAKAGKTKVVDLYKPPVSIQPIIRNSGLPEGLGGGEPFASTTEKYYQRKELIEHLNSYIKKNDLLREEGEYVKLDQVLGDALFKNANTDLVSRLDLNNAFLNKMVQYHAIVRPNQEPVLKKGAVKKIQIQIEQRMGRKMVTLFRNLEDWLIDPEQFSKDLQKRLGVGVSVSDMVVGKNAQPAKEVLCQGNVAPQAGEVLVKEYHVPKIYIEVYDKAAEKRKK